MKKNVKKKIGVGVEMFGALAGTAYGGTKEDLDSVIGSVKANSATKVWDVRINNGPKHEMHQFQKNGVTIETTDYATLFKRNIGEKTLYACDQDNDGDLDRTLILNGTDVSKSDDAFAKQECLSGDSLDKELSMADMFKWGEGETPYNTRDTLDFNEGVAYRIGNEKKVNLSNPEKLAEDLYKGAINSSKNVL